MSHWISKKQKKKKEKEDRQHGCLEGTWPLVMTALVLGSP
jgi:hypothetical protein